MVLSSRLAVALGVLVLMAGWTPLASAEDQIVTLTNDLGCWFFAAPPPPYQVFIRSSGSAPEERTDFAESFFHAALGPGPTGKALVARPGGVYRFGPGGLFKIFDLPSGFAPTDILSHRSGRVYVLGQTSGGNALATWMGSGEAVVEPSGGVGPITGVDLAEDGCTAIQASGGVRRSNLCVAPHAWEPWIEMTNASAAFFAPNHQILIQALRQSPGGGYTQIVQVRDTISLAVISEYSMPRTHTVIGLSSDPSRFWTIPADCGGYDFSLRQHDLLTGELVGEQFLTTGEPDDRPHVGIVERGWRAALAQPATADVPAVHPALLLVLITALTSSALFRVR